MAGAGAWGNVDRGTGCDVQSLGVDVEDTDDISAEVGDNEVLFRWVDEDLVGVGSSLAGGIGARFGRGEVKVLECAVGSCDGIHLPGGQSPSVVGHC